MDSLRRKALSCKYFIFDMCEGLLLATLNSLYYFFYALTLVRPVSLSSARPKLALPAA